MVLSITLLIVGFLLLLFGADKLVDGASTLAKRLKVPNIVIGLTIVSFGTSAPELVVNVFASVSGNAGIVMGNVIGSNIFNTFAILGIASLIYPLAVKSNTTWIEIPLSLLAGLAIFILAGDRLIDGAGQNAVLQSDGIILLLFFTIFLGYNVHSALGGKTEEEMETKNWTVTRSVLMLLLGLALLIISGRMIVIGAEDLALQAGISQRIIGLTVISICTSLPELATSVVAARKRNVDLALGNVVGSNIFNIFFILGVSATTAPVAVSDASQIDIIVYLFGSLLLFFFIFTGKGHKLERWEGIVLLVVYLAYMVWLITS